MLFYTIFPPRSGRLEWKLDAHQISVETSGQKGNSIMNVCLEFLPCVAYTLNGFAFLKALSKNGKIFGNNMMVGVKQCIDKVSFYCGVHWKDGLPPGSLMLKYKGKFSKER